MSDKNASGDRSSSVRMNVVGNTSNDDHDNEQLRQNRLQG